MRIGRVIFLVAAAFALALPSAAFAGHSWNGFHWAKTSSATRALTVSDGVSGDWDAVFPGVLTDWNTSLNSLLSLSDASGKANISTHSGNYGNNGWLGMAQVWLKGGHISRAVVKLNDFYFAVYPLINTLAAKQQVFCQEVGHTLGLGHWPTDTCMNDTNDLATTPYPHPNAHDAEQLAAIYNHVDEITRRGAHEAGPFTIDVFPAP